ncbi:MAG: phosphoglycolate phosphatase [Rhodobacter sp.]|uniref:phosphoglycolate phosphatase n=1 Tax=Pararhodobacter sp. TaxID=2127056 RepID=UPI001E0B89F8|nr:phosphoglycolate phosphatase [Pararhodobacter sp.]MCB1346771.1 phosphoglycolate phosphatase [Paracoccaceae bacterium]MCC0072375.1 phosphoglycolate phosphatase [Rhodobacter sp.]HPD91490.1 phosphoglycolate phosphatase [Pararhodobacter sp.]
MRAVFDLDGTLIDSAPDIHAAGCAALASEGLPPVTAEQSRSFIGNGARVYVERLERAAAGGNEAPRTERLRQHFAREYEVAHALTRIYPGVEQALHLLKSQGWRLGLCTNKPIAPTLSVLAHFGWGALFETVLGGDSLPVNKPDPAPLRATLAGLGEGPAVYVGDSEVDAATAQAAGVPFALFTSGYRKTPVAEIAHQRAFEDWADLPAIARALAR